MIDGTYCQCSVEEKEYAYWVFIKTSHEEQDRMGIFYLDDGRRIRGCYKPGTRNETVLKVLESLSKKESDNEVIKK